MRTKKSPQANAGSNKIHGKCSKKFLINMPKKLGLPSGRKYYFQETKKGYRLYYGKGMWIGMPKQLVEDNPHLYTFEGKGRKYGK